MHFDFISRQIIGRITWAEVLQVAIAEWEQQHPDREVMSVSVNGDENLITIGYEVRSSASKAETTHARGSDPLEQLLMVGVYCPKCDGTGVYMGMYAKARTGHVCFKCKGTGQIFVNLFKGRRELISLVELVYMTSPTNPYPTGDSVTYEAFLAGKMPTEGPGKD